MSLPCPNSDRPIMFGAGRECDQVVFLAQGRDRASQHPALVDGINRAIILLLACRNRRSSSVNNIYVYKQKWQLV